MSDGKEKKRVNKKSLDYVRPQPGKFTLEAFPNVEFKFRKMTIDDDAWAEATFGMNPYAMISQKTANTEDLCRLYFHFLDAESKTHFKPITEKEPDYEKGGEKETLIPGHRRFMKSIGAGLVEVFMIANAFGETLLSSRPISDLPEELKKNLMAQVEKKTESGPMGSEIVDLRK